MAQEVLTIRINAVGGATVQREAAKAKGALGGVEGSARRTQTSLTGTAKGAQTSGRAFGVMGGSARKATSALRSTIGTVVRFAAVGTGFYGIAAGISKAARTTIDFDKAMRNVNSIAQLSEAQFEDLRGSVLDLAGPTAQVPQTLAQGMYDLVSSGFDAADSLKIVEAAARAATAGLTTTDVSTKAVAAVLNAYRKPAEQAGAVSDTLFRTVDRGVISFEELASNIGTVLPFASSAGITLREVGASIATLTKQGIGGANAITFLKNTYVAFNKPSADLNKAIKQTGYESGEALIKAKGFQGALDAVIATTDGSRKAVTNLFPNIRALNAVLGLTGENSRAAAKDLRGMEKDTGATATVLAQQSKSIAYQWNRLKAEASVLAIEVGDKLKPALAGVLGAVTSVIVALQGGDGAVSEFVQSFARVPLVRNSFEVVRTTIERTVDAVQALISIGRTLAPVFAPLVSVAGVFLRSEAAVRVFNVALGAAVGYAVAFAARWVVLAAAIQVGKFVALAASIRNVSAAFIALRAAFAANPLGLLLTVVGAVAGAMGVFAGKEREAAGSARDLASALDRQRDALLQLQDATLGVREARTQQAAANTQALVAERNYERAVRQSGKGSLDARQAHDALRQARDAQARANLSVSQSEGRLNDTEKETLDASRETEKQARARIMRLYRQEAATKGAVKAAEEFRKGQGPVARAMGQLNDQIAISSDSARDLAERYASVPRLVQTLITADDERAVERVDMLAQKLERLGGKRTVAKILAESKTAEGAARKMKQLLEAIPESWRTKLNVESRDADTKLDRTRSKIDAFPALKEVHIRVSEQYQRSGGSINALLNGGRARGGFVDRPMVMVGEEAPRHPEYVIATNPAYRTRNVGLFAAAGRDLGIPGFQRGGVASGSTVQIDQQWQQFGLVDRVIREHERQAAEGVQAPAGGGGEWRGGNTLDFGRMMARMFGLSMTSTYRSPGHNRSVGGVEGSKHTHGTPANPGAIDFVPPSREAAAFARAHGIPEVLIHDAGSGLHLHLGFFAMGGVLTRPELKGLVTSKRFRNPDIAAAVAEGESARNSKAVGDGGSSLGLFQINRPSHPQYTRANLLNASTNADAAKEISNGGANWQPWTVYRTGAYRRFVPLYQNTEGDGGQGDGGGGKQDKSVLAQLEAHLARAELTPRFSDDLRYERKLLGYWRRRMRGAQRRHDFSQITESAHNVKQYQDAVQETRRQMREKDTPEDSVFELGGLSKIGKWNIAGAQGTLDAIQLSVSQAALTEAYDADDNLTPASLGDDVSAAQRLVTFWQDIYNLAAGTVVKRQVFNKRGKLVDVNEHVEGTVRQKTEAADNLKSARDTLRNIQTEIGNYQAPGEDDSGIQRQLLELVKQENVELRQRVAVAERQAPFLGAFADGGVALVGETGPEVAHFPSGTRIHSADDTRSMLQPQVTVRPQFVIHGDRATAEILERAIDHVADEVDDRIGQTAGAAMASVSSPGRYATYGRQG